MISISDHIAKLLHDERSAHLQAEATRYRQARAALRRRRHRRRLRPTAATKFVEPVRVPSQRRERDPARGGGQSKIDDPGRVGRPAA